VKGGAYGEGWVGLEGARGRREGKEKMEIGEKGVGSVVS